MNAEILIDYLTFTIKGDYQVNEVIEFILGLDISVFEHSKGINFYRQSRTYNNIRVLSDGVHEGMGICVNMSGRGCRTWEEHHNKSIISLLEQIRQHPNINFTRIDIACDDKIGSLDLEKIWDYANEGKYRTRSRSRNNHESFKDSNEGAKTLYFGSRSSKVCIRIYDKAKQQDLTNTHWVRFELVLKAEYATQAVKILVESKQLGSAVAGIIDDKFAFVELDDSNISRCRIADWWENFLGEVQAVELTTKEKITHNIDEHKLWLKEGCGRIVAKVVEAVGYDEFNKEIKEYGKQKLTVADIAMIEDYKNKKGAVRLGNIPTITNLDTAIRIFYENPEIGNKEITQLFTKKSKSTINRLKRLAHKQMLDDNIYTHGMYKLNTKSAFKAWGIDVEDLETRRNKLKELGL